MNSKLKRAWKLWRDKKLAWRTRGTETYGWVIKPERYASMTNIEHNERRGNLALLDLNGGRQ